LSRRKKEVAKNSSKEKKIPCSQGGGDRKGPPKRGRRIDLRRNARNGARRKEPIKERSSTQEKGGGERRSGAKRAPYKLKSEGRVKIGK